MMADEKERPIGKLAGHVAAAALPKSEGERRIELARERARDWQAKDRYEIVRDGRIIAMFVTEADRNFVLDLIASWNEP